MSLNIHYCRLCLQKTQESAKTLSKDSKIFALVTNLFPGMDTSLVINSKLCSECFKFVQLSNLMIESVRRNEQKIMLNLQNVSEKSTCRLCLSNENLEAAICLVKNTNEEARHIIEMAIVDLDFNIFRNPVMCHSCWQKVKSIYLFKKKCFATEKILKYYCASNKINSLDRREFELVSFLYQEKLQHFSENLNKQNFVFERNTGSPCNLNVIKNIMNPLDMGDLNNFPKNEHDFFEEVVDVVEIIRVESDLPKEEYEIDIIEHKLSKFDDSDGNKDLTVDTNHDSENKTTSAFNCEKCPYETREVDIEFHLKAHQSKKNHLETSETRPKIFKCQECDYVSEKHTCLVTHMPIHQDKYDFSCDKCNYQAKRKSDMNSHMLSHQDKYKFSCLKCNYQTNLKSRLVAHILIHQENYNFSCDKCNYQTKTKGGLIKHMVTHQDQYNFKCSKCSYRAKCKAYLAKHMLVHQENYNFSCDKCNYQTKRKGCLINHMVTHQDQYNFKCSKCSYRGKFNASLVKHMLVHQENYKFSCDKCNYQTKRKDNLNIHMVTHQDQYNFKCSKCSYRGKRKDCLAKHMLVHQETYKFSCHNCNYQAKRKDMLITHMSVHQEKYNFSCFKCNYQTNRKECLVRHMVIHQENYKFSCDKCNYQTNRKYRLVRHMLIHQDKYNFKCSKCSYRAKCKAHLVKHLLVHPEN